ncbi:hypothetical protein [Olsenella profusa]|uniref:Uncharacterized protein n=1 Tax=Olsenella profusa F0195 TaxID=1125712 RepID=U2T613_9ACTN|nr:hypothetical protein [Olsenella profusa]ERL08499.1 hypothetical protein HMPREF1316_2025 [Olsenella profusa F0195]
MGQEAALAFLWLNQEKIPGNYTDAGITPDLLQLREGGLIDLTTDWGHELAIVKAITPVGRTHYDEARRARRKFRTVSDSADELILKLVAEDAAKQGDGGMRMATIYDDRDNDYWELSRNGLLNVDPADNMPWIATITDEGQSYAEGWFLDQMESDVKVILNNTNNNTITSSADASVNVSDVTLSTTVAAILDLDIDQAVKDAAEAAAKELDAASKKKDKASFAEKLEKVAHIAKSSASLAEVLLPLVKATVGTLLG